ncbi:hypothetical protein EDC04DRAFT_2602289 [Pisolithus marmoratus]|nr:hypothetical protein EDC04DRAFT_2602289 [Pisolithus marmoratus]
MRLLPYAGPFINAWTSYLPMSHNTLLWYHQWDSKQNWNHWMKSMEAARSDCQISLMRKDLAYEIVHHNTIALQLNRIMLERAEVDLLVADKLVGHIQLTIRQSGHLAVVEYAILVKYQFSGTVNIFLKVNEIVLLQYWPPTEVILGQTVPIPNIA